MKAAVVLLFILLVGLSTIRAEYLSPLDAIKTKGSLILTDGIILYVFLPDHTFYSSPIRQSGRTFNGVWTAEQTTTVRCTFTVEAEQGWINGIFLPGEYRKIVFAVYGGTTRVFKSELSPDRDVWTGTFSMDDPIEIPKPSNWPIR